MIIRKTLFLCISLSFAFHSVDAASLAEQFTQAGYVEICDANHGAVTFDMLYVSFDQLIEFLQKNPVWVQKLYRAKERFIRSKDRNYYATDFFGLYDESERKGRSQIAFYYSTHFHDFICACYPEFKQIPEIIGFFQACREIQAPYATVFQGAAAQLGLDNIFLEHSEQVPILFKVIKYLPLYSPTAPHYDGTVFSLFLDSTDNQSLLLSPYKSSFIIDDFSSPLRQFARSDKSNSILLIPGTLLADFSIWPTPHIVEESGKIRYATIAFAMRPHFISQKQVLSPLPNFKH